MHLLAASGVFAASQEGWTHTEASRLLRSDHPMSIRAYARMMGLPMVWDSLAELAKTVSSGVAGPDTFGPGGSWAYLQENPDQERLFGEAMTAKAAADVGAVLAAYDFSGFGTVADIGGGHGHLLRAILDRSPDTKGILFDLPEVVDAVVDVHPNTVKQGGDFFNDPLPSADAYVLMDIIHDWADEEAVAILRSARAAAAPGATLLVIENIDRGGPTRPSRPHARHHHADRHRRPRTDPNPTRRAARTGRLPFGTGD